MGKSARRARDGRASRAPRVLENAIERTSAILDLERRAHARICSDRSRERLLPREELDSVQA
eukprot:15237046-Alexandrium_andersonii.AAC.1